MYVVWYHAVALAFSLHAAEDAAEKPAPKKVVYGKKKPAKKEAVPGDAADKVSEEEQAALAERQAAEEAAKRAQVIMLVSHRCSGMQHSWL